MRDTTWCELTGVFVLFACPITILLAITIHSTAGLMRTTTIVGEFEEASFDDDADTEFIEEATANGGKRLAVIKQIRHIVCQKTKGLCRLYF